MAPTVRQLTSSEWRLLRTVRLRALRDAPHAFGSSFAEEVAKDEAWWTTTTGSMAWFVADDGEIVVGMVASLAPTARAPRRCCVISMWVAPEWRGTSTAWDLLDSVAGWARRQGVEELELGVSESNERARRFYQRAGFTPTGTREPLRSNPSMFTMTMRLALGESKDHERGA